MLRRIALATAVAGLALAGPSAADVNVGINIGVPPPPPVVVAEPPRLVVVPRSPVYYAPTLPYNYFYYDGRYYTHHDGAWFYGAAANGPWVYIATGRVPHPVLAVPVTYYKVPPGHRKHWRRHGKHKHRHKHDHDD